MAARDDLHLSRAAWRTSTCSGDGNNCVEVATAWRTSSHSGPNGGNCVEVAADAGARVLVRDTKQDGRGQIHSFTAKAWREFVAQLKTEEINH